jgi:hypothetical protein
MTTGATLYARVKSPMPDAPRQQKRIIIRKGDVWRINGAIVSSPDRDSRLVVSGDAERVKPDRQSTGDAA